MSWVRRGLRWWLVLALGAGLAGKAAAQDPCFLAGPQLEAGLHHCRHAELLDSLAPGYNGQVLAAVDAVQASAPEGGGYFMGVRADPPESPIGYVLRLFGQPLLTPPRTSSYCSGSSYTVFIEALNRIFPDGKERLSPERLEAMRMQEPDGSRREDEVKAWGWWNADGFGSDFALRQYLGMGDAVSPQEARPGDFLNISWLKGNGHSVVFLGYARDEQGGLQVVFFSSQASSNGLADQRVSAARVQEVRFVRLTRPEALFSFDPHQQVRRDVPGDTLDDF